MLVEIFDILMCYVTLILDFDRGKDKISKERIIRSYFFNFMNSKQSTKIIRVITYKRSIQSQLLFSYIENNKFSLYICVI